MSLTRVRDAIANNRVVIGTHYTGEDIGMYEICGHCGYDFIWIDAEHGPMTLNTILDGVVGTNAGGCAAFVRVAWNDPVLAKPVLEMGVDGVIFPMVNTAAEAEKAVKSCLYPPEGTRGFGPIRGIGYHPMNPGDVQKYIEESNKNIFKIIQAETAECVKNLDEILEVPGIDLVMVGPMDLSGSIGKLGQLRDPEVLGLIRSIAEKCNNHKIPFGVSIGYDLELVKYFIELGATFISMGSGYAYFAMMSQEAIKGIRSIEEEVR